MWRPPSWWVIAALVYAASAVYLLKRRVLAPRALVLGAIFLTGTLTIQVRGSGISGPVWLGDGEAVFVTAHVIAEGNVQSEGPAELHQRIDVETENIELAAPTSARQTSAMQTSPPQGKEVHAVIRLNIYSRMGSDFPRTPQPRAMQLLRYGQRIQFPATLMTPRNYRNPGAFDYAGYLREKGIVATASTKYAAIQLLPGFAGSRIMLWLSRVHRSVIGKVHALWPEHVAELMDAIVLGEESFIDRPARVDFQRSALITCWWSRE